MSWPRFTKFMMHTTEQIIPIAGAPDYTENKKPQSFMSGMTKTLNLMITKQQIDKYFNSNYKFLVLSITKTKIKYQQVTEWDVEELLSATYIHLIDNMNSNI